ncbi:VMAP-C domain-containing protein [Nocardiopsis halotolerans]|uniref:VMAP-C domain-containing protein n=1 Tax=Nocardiopsis halotolerans TaxID=124252 RepID=UPI000371FB8B|nr:trypsin-like peptidase domain-containing protein [Nocardiopsis halotolerans]
MPGFSWRARLSAMDEGTGEERTLGSAFLVGSRHVVTCAHNVERVDDDTWVRVLFPLAGDDGDLLARVVKRANRRAGEPDVAVLELFQDTLIPSAPLLSIDTLPLPDPTRLVADTASEGYDVQLSALGFPTGAARGTPGDGRSSEKVFDDAKGAVLQLLTTFDQRVTQDRWQIRLLLGEPGTIRHGYSGGGAYLTRAWWRGWESCYGHVVGMVCTGDERVEGQSGTLISLEAIARVWEEIDDHVDLGWLDTAARRELRPIVTELADEVDFARVHEVSVPHFQHDPDAGSRPSSPWQWVRHTAEKGMSADRADDLRRFLRRVHDHLPPDRRGELGAWLARHHGEELTHPVAPSYVTVVAHKLLYDGTYTVTLRREDDGVPGEPLELTGVSEDGIRASVERHLNALLLDHGRRDANTLFEFVVPVPLFHQDFELWNLTSFMQITDRYPVVVSASELHMTLYQGAETASDDETGTAFHRNAATRQRWDRLQAQGSAGAEVFACTKATDRVKTKRKLNACFDKHALIHSTRARDPHLEGALDAGVPIMLLPRRACGHESHDDCSGARRAEQLKRLVEATPFDKLAVKVHDVRRQALGEDDEEEHCGHELSLVVNDPERIDHNTDPPMYMASEDPV